VYLSKSEANRDQIREQGCLDLLLNELKSTRAIIVHNTMAALVNVTIANAANQNFVREEGAMQLVVQMMSDPKDPKTRHNACWLLKKLAANNQKNRDAMREMGALTKVVPLLSRDELPEVQEHAVALLAILLDKHTRNRMTFKDIAGGPAAVTGLLERVAGTGTKAEEYAQKCVDSLGGARKMHEDSGGSARTHSGSLSVASSTRERGGSTGSSPRLTPRKEEKSPRTDPKSPRRDVKSPSTSKRDAEKTSFARSPRPAGPASEKEKKGGGVLGLFGKRKDAQVDDGVVLKGSGRRSKDNEEINESFG
jgi:hypothetical protein